jgi:hypothetical protein
MHKGIQHVLQNTFQVVRVDVLLSFVLSFGQLLHL